ncbi:MAG: hypothetical protein E6H65_07420 [Betaproteobacteria bacterium]|nr:MAG: hypothetical protein E6H65_07420 [Betaproteobacteria bacterium]
MQIWPLAVTDGVEAKVLIGAAAASMAEPFPMPLSNTRRRDMTWSASPVAEITDAAEISG